MVFKFQYKLKQPNKKRKPGPVNTLKPDIVSFMSTAENNTLLKCARQHTDLQQIASRGRHINTYCRSGDKYCYKHVISKTQNDTIKLVAKVHNLAEIIKTMSSHIISLDKEMCSIKKVFSLNCL